MAAQALRPAKEKSSAEPIYVFGTDLSGQHRNEYGDFAVDFHAAERGKGSGPSGNAYALPYQNSKGQLLDTGQIANYVESLLGYMRNNPHSQFQVTRFACESGAHGDDTMARLFAHRPENCQLPGLWTRILDQRQAARVLLFDPGVHLKTDDWQQRLKKFLDLNAPLWDVPGFELVSTGAAKMIVANDAAAKKLGLRHRIIGQNEGYYGQRALLAAETRAVWYATHLISIMDFEQTAQPQQIRVIGAATRGGLHIEQIDASED